jgi:hypothetical protein
LHSTARGSHPYPTSDFMHRVANVYFHVNVNCIRLKQPYFVPHTTVLSSSVAQYLRPERVWFTTLSLVEISTSTYCTSRYVHVEK